MRYLLVPPLLRRFKKFCFAFYEQGQPNLIFLKELIECAAILIVALHFSILLLEVSWILQS
jgi:hypothetical protein